MLINRFGKKYLNEEEYKRTRFLRGDIVKNKNYAPPTPYDVLSCITKYDPGTFDNFCGEFGYSTDSRAAEKTYKSVLEEWNNVERIFNPSEIESLIEIQ